MNKITSLFTNKVGLFTDQLKDLPDRRRIFLVRVLIIIATLIINVIISPKAALGTRAALFLVVGIIGIFGLVILLKHPYLGLVGLAGASLIVPFEIGTGSESALNIAILIVALMAGIMILKILIKRNLSANLIDRPIVPVIGLMLISILAFISGQLVYFSTSPAPIRAQLGGMGLFILSGFAFLEAAYFIRSIQLLKWLTWIFLASGSINLLSYIFPFLGSIIIATAYGSQYWVWMLAISFSQALINNKMNKNLKVLFWVLTGVIIVIGLFVNRDWISGWLPGLMSVGVILWFYERRLRLPLFMGGALLMAVNSHVVTDLFMGGDNQYSLFTRLEAWKILGQIIQVNPILGVGPANYYWYTPIFQILGYSVSFNSHNNYIDIIAQTGILGLICFLWIAWELGRLAWRLIKSSQEGFAKAYIYGAMGGLVGSWASGMLGDWIIPFVYNVGFKGFRASVFGWFFLGGLVALDKIRQAKPEKSER